MAWRKQSPAPARPPGGNSRAVGSSSRLPEFCHGLYPILLQGDPEAFRRYLTQWEDVIGDTAEMEATSTDQLRRTMAALLRCPQQFNLPAWRPSAGSPPEDPLREGGHEAPSRKTADGSDASAHLLQEARPHAQAVPPAAPPPSIHPRPDDPAPGGVYQLDMVTGELVPISERTMAEAEPLPYAAERKPTGRAPRRRRSAANLRQLTFWPEGDA